MKYNIIFNVLNGGGFLRKVQSFSSEGGESVSVIKVKANEPFENALRRFTKKCTESGIKKEANKRRYYKKPSLKRKEDRIEAAKKRKRKSY
jgi:small subunit ribosomal protein S21